jgi:hypothetical protein
MSAELELTTLLRRGTARLNRGHWPSAQKMVTARATVSLPVKAENADEKIRGGWSYSSLEIHS